VVAALTLVVWFGPATPSLDIGGSSSARPAELQADMSLYHHYAGEIAAGKVPYRDFFVEYPPLSLPALAAAHVLGSEPDRFRDGFFALFGLIAAACSVIALLAARAARLDRTTQLAAGGLVALAPLLLGHELAPNRLDLLPVLFAGAAALAAASRRDTLGGVLAGLGAATKLWPALLVVPLVALAFRRGGRRGAVRAGAGFAIAFALPYGLAALASPGGVLDAIRFQTERPLQVEAIPATALLALRRIGLVDVESEGSFESRSVNLVGDATGLVATLATVAGLAVVLALLFAGTRLIVAARDDQDAFAAAMLTGLAATVAVLAFAKVLSPQFVLWLVPLPLLVGGRLRWVAGGLVALALALTNAAFERIDAYQYDYALGATAIYLGRDLVLLALLALLAVCLRRRPFGKQADVLRR